MTALDTAFAACGVVAVIGGLFAVTTRHVVHAALWLVVALVGVSGALLVLGAELVALVLVLVYVGAVVVLVLFAIMLTRAPIGPDLQHRVGLWRTLGAGLLGAAVATLLGSVLLPLADGTVRLGPIVLPAMRLQAQALALASGRVKVAVRPEAWAVHPAGAAALAATVLKSVYLGSLREYTFSTALGEIFVTTADLLRVWQPGEAVSLALTGNGLSVLAA